MFRTKSESVRYFALELSALTPVHLAKISPNLFISLRFLIKLLTVIVPNTNWKKVGGAHPNKRTDIKQRTNNTHFGVHKNNENMRQFHYSRINIYASPITKVIFRKFKQGGDIIALFPEQLNQSNMMIGSYMHVGQHSDADYNGVIATTTPATEGEYIELMSELKRMGYDELQVMEAQQLLICCLSG